jgi:hypothetical protein
MDLQVRAVNIVTRLALDPRKIDDCIKKVQCYTNFCYSTYFPYSKKKIELGLCDLNALCLCTPPSSFERLNKSLGDYIYIKYLRPSEGRIS